MKVLSTTVIIPTYNMSSHLVSLWKSIVDSRLLENVESVCFWDDGSTDGTHEVLEGIAKESEKVLIKKNNRNLGRFETRFIAAQTAQTETILFLDSRIHLPKTFAEAFREVYSNKNAVMGCVDIDVRSSLYALYWQRSHERLFWRHYRDTKRPLWLTTQNYDDYLKGTGVLLVPREAFLNACQVFEGQSLLSDDTYLLKELVKACPILIYPDLRIDWIPRETAIEFLHRLWDRGPSFVEYHVFQRRGAFFWAVLSGLTGGFILIILFALWPRIALNLLLGIMGALFLSAGLFAKNPIEAVKLLPLHLGVIFSFGAGIIRGLWVNLNKETHHAS